jgi:hypothetical protein
MFLCCLEYILIDVISEFLAECHNFKSIFCNLFTHSENSNLCILDQTSDDFQSLDKQNIPRSQTSGADCDTLLHKDALIFTLVSSFPITQAL